MFFRQLLLKYMHFQISNNPMVKDESCDFSFGHKHSFKPINKKSENAFTKVEMAVEVVEAIAGTDSVCG